MLSFLSNWLFTKLTKLIFLKVVVNYLFFPQHICLPHCQTPWAIHLRKIIEETVNHLQANSELVLYILELEYTENMENLIHCHFLKSFVVLVAGISSNSAITSLSKSLRIGGAMKLFSKRSLIKVAQDSRLWLAEECCQLFT